MQMATKESMGKRQEQVTRLDEEIRSKRMQIDDLTAKLKAYADNMSDFKSAAKQKETKLRASMSEWEEKLLHLRNEVHRYQCDHSDLLDNIKRSQEVLLSVQKKKNENEGNEWQLGSAALKTKLEEFVRNQKDALSAEVKNIHEKARSDLQELVDEVTEDLQSSAYDLESKITKIEKQHETLKKRSSFK